MSAAQRLSPLVARILLGLVFTVFGANGFLQFMPPPPVSPEAGAFLGALGATGYFFPLLSGTELAAGVLLLAGRFVPLALLLLAPVVVHVVAFHLTLAPMTPLAVLVLVGELFLAWAYRASFRGVLAARAVPGGEDGADAGRVQLAG